MMLKKSILITLIVILYCATLPMNVLFEGHFIGLSRSPDIIQNIFGSMREFVAVWAFMKAEEYHHRGLPFIGAIGYHENESGILEESSHPQAGREKEKEHKKNVKLDLFSRIYSSVKVTEDSHLTPGEEKEVLPWFYIEVMFDPHDVRGYVLGAYWLERLNREDESLKFLKEGEKNNPRSAQILGYIGKIYYKQSDTASALLYLEHATKLWLEGKQPNVITNKYMKSDRFFNIDLLATLYEKLGEYQKAINIYRLLYAMDQAPILLEKIDRIEKLISKQKVAS